MFLFHGVTLAVVILSAVSVSTSTAKNLDRSQWHRNRRQSHINTCGESIEAISVQPLIVNGIDAHIGLFPWHAGVYWRQDNNGTESWDQKCGGSLISVQFVLTAAHCVVDKKEEDVRIALGKYYRSWNHSEPSEQKFNVTKVLYPQEFSKNTFIFDIALVLLENKIKFGEHIMPVCHGSMGGSNDIQDENLFIVGWGQTMNQPCGSSSETLLYKDVSLVPSSDCKRKAPSYYSTFEKFCITKNNSEVSVAQAGDSGGGLTAVFDGLHYIVGIVSIKFDKYSMLTNVSWPTHLKWIKDQIYKFDRNFTWNEKEEVTLNETLGEVCKLQGKLTWSCKSLTECPEAQLNLWKGIRPEACQSSGDEPLVCCENTANELTKQIRDSSQLVQHNTSASPKLPPGVKSMQQCEEFAKVFKNLDDGSSCAMAEAPIVTVTDAKPREFPHMAEIGYVERDGSMWWNCGASLISDRFVLTSAFCRARFGSPAVKVRLGRHDVATTKDDSKSGSHLVEYDIIEIIIHPEYSGDSTSRNNNIALFRLKENVKINKHVRPICLLTEDTPTDTHATITGWGRLSGYSYVKKANVTIIGSNNCTEIFQLEKSNFSTATICAEKRSEGCLSAYSGAPLQIRLKTPYCMDSLVGIPTLGFYCENLHFYTKIAYYIPWIESVVWR